MLDAPRQGITLTEHAAQAEQHYERALAANARMGARPWLAHTQRDFARMLHSRNGSGDRERAHELLARARDSYRELGMDSYARSLPDEIT